MIMCFVRAVTPRALTVDCYAGHRIWSDRPSSCEAHRRAAEGAKVSNIGLTGVGCQHAGEGSGADHLASLQSDVRAGELISEPRERHPAGTPSCAATSKPVSC